VTARVDGARTTVRQLLGIAPVESPIRLSDIDPSGTHGIHKHHAIEEAATSQARLLELQTRLFAEGRRSLLIVLQGMDTSGKDGTVNHVMSHFNPGGFTITNFKIPTADEARHGFLWRIRRALPKPGYIAIFNRSQYEDVLITRVKNLVPSDAIERRYSEINAFESSLVTDGTTIVKICLHISYEEQRMRLLERLNDPAKRWKFSAHDLIERGHWDEYQVAYELAITHCSSSVPWYVVPANEKWFRDWAVTEILLETLEQMNPHYPEPVLDIKAMRAQLQPAI
jgi:PPK2 family polyphosphate:nucleotide phosphotransferase